MFTWIFLRETAIKFTLSLVVLCLNMVGIAFLASLYNYDAAIRYLGNGEVKTATLQLSLAVLLIVCAINMLFASSLIIKRFFKA